MPALVSRGQRWTWQALALGVLLGGVSASVGCTVGAGGLAAVTSAEARLPTMLLATGVEGSDCTSAVVRLPHHPSLARAIARALEDVDGAVVLTDARVETTFFWTGVYNRRCVRVRGGAARMARQIVLPAPAGHHGHH